MTDAAATPCVCVYAPLDSRGYEEHVVAERDLLRVLRRSRGDTPRCCAHWRGSGQHREREPVGARVPAMVDVFASVGTNACQLSNERDSFKQTTSTAQDTSGSSADQSIAGRVSGDAKEAPTPRRSHRKRSRRESTDGGPIAAKAPKRLQRKKRRKRSDLLAQPDDSVLLQAEFSNSESTDPWKQVFHESLTSPFDEAKHPALANILGRFLVVHGRAIWERARSGCRTPPGRECVRSCKQSGGSAK